MKALFVLVAAFVLGLPQPLAPSDDAHRPYFAGMPPGRFQGESVATVIFANDVAQYCDSKVPEGYVLVACTKRFRSGDSIVVLPSPCQFGDQEFFARIACHESAHALGWPASHPR